VGGGQNLQGEGTSIAFTSGKMRKCYELYWKINGWKNSNIHVKVYIHSPTTTLTEISEGLP
jgi:hypothetical protein